MENYRHIVTSLEKKENTPIHIVGGRDSICRACPHQSASGCTVEEKIESLDSRHAQILRLTHGDVLSWREAKQRLKKHMTLKRFHLACLGCEWKAWGVCEAALKKLRIPSTSNENKG